MIRWIPFAFVRILFFLIAGILFGIIYPDSLSIQIAAVTLVVVAILYAAFRFIFPRYPWVFGIPGFLAVFLCGYCHVYYSSQLRNETHFVRHAHIRHYKAVISGYPEEKDKSWKVVAEVRAVDTGTWVPADGRILLYFSKSDFRAALDYGDMVVINGSPATIPGPSNPGEFDYRRFLSYKNIYHQDFLRAARVSAAGNEPPSQFMLWAVTARREANNILKKYVTGANEQGIASALVLGVTDGLDDDLLKSYSATGSMHVLAVSGLHITIIYLIIVTLLKPLTRTRRGNWILAIISLLILWAYAFITGLTPSVLRAVTMFSFIVVARASSRHTNIYNTLAASAVCLLMFDPFLVMSVGFQLSYLAVLGIVYLHPLIYRAWEPKWRLVEEVWKITSVSIAAQLATFAIGLLYFHQFPNYFLLSNILVIPLSFVVLIAGLLLIAVSFIDLVATAVGWLLTYSIKLLNLAVEGVEWLPYSLIENISITAGQCILLMLSVVALALMAEKRKFAYFVCATALLISFSAIQWSPWISDPGGSKLRVYRVPGHRAADVQSGDQVFFLSDTVLRSDQQKINFHITPGRLLAGGHALAQRFPVREIPGGMVMHVSNKTILYIMEDPGQSLAALRPDVVIVANDALQTPTSFGGAVLVLDSSNSYAYSNQVRRDVQSSNLSLHSVLHDGAFELIL